MVRREDYQAIYLSAEVLVKLGRGDEALEASRHGVKLADGHLELNPDDARAWYLSAAALMQLGQREQATQRARRASAIDPEDSGVLYNVGCVYALAGSTDEALDHLDKAIQNGFGQREWVENDSDWDAVRTGLAFRCCSANFDLRRISRAGLWQLCSGASCRECGSY